MMGETMGILSHPHVSSLPEERDIGYPGEEQVAGHHLPEVK
jgi:hypothetical protein